MLSNTLFPSKQRAVIGDIFTRSTRRVFNNFLQVLDSILHRACLLTSSCSAGVGPHTKMNCSLRLCLCRVLTCLASLQLSVTSSAAYWFPTSHLLPWWRRPRRSLGGAAEGPGRGPLRAHPGARSLGQSCGPCSARRLLTHTTSLTALGERTAFVCCPLMCVCLFDKGSESILKQV